MNEIFLTDIQKAYISGEKMAGHLGGVGTHVYLEVEGENISPDILRKAWREVLHLHPVLSASIEEQQKIVFHKSHYNNYVPVFDLSGLTNEQTKVELSKIRRAISHRRMQVEFGHTCGLFLSICPDQTYRLHFDLNLMVCDVVSFQILLRDLATAYAGKVQHEVVYPKSKKTAYSSDDKAYWIKRIPHMPLGPELELNKNPEKMHGCQYKPLIHRLSKRKWNNFKNLSNERGIAPHIALLAVFALTVHRFSKNQSFLLNIPIFKRNIQNMDYLADDTAILLLESKYHKDNTFSNFISGLALQYYKDLEHLNFSGLVVQSLLKKKHPECIWPAPVVFSATPQIKLLSDKFCEIFGKLIYMVSQTPQVWLDAQTHEIGDEQYSFWMLPEELFADDTINEMFKDYVDRLELLAADDSSWD